MSLSDKIRAIVHELLRRIGLRILSSCIAPDFDPEDDYLPGQLVMHDGNIYICKEGHRAGPWTLGDFDETTIDKVLSELRLDGKFPDEIYIREYNGDKYHQIVVKPSGGRYTIAVDQNGKTKQ